jgi:hypothetical protein
MLLVLSADPDCLRGIAQITQDITNDHLPHSIRPYILPSTLIALEKNNGAGIRPIAIGEVFYRLAAYRCHVMVMRTARTLLAPIQLGIGVPGACEAIVHNIQHALEKCTPEEEPMAALAVDFRNAFNCVSRKAILNSVYSHLGLRHIWRLVHFAYSSPSALYTRDDEGRYVARLYSCEGVRQGDPISALLFSVAIQPVYVNIIRQHQSLRATAILDDCTFVGPVGALVSAYATICQEAALVGLEVQPTKSQLIYFQSDRVPLPSDITEFIARNRVQLQLDSAIILGAPVGRTAAKREELALRTLRDHVSFFQALLRDEMPVQEAVHLLRVSGTPRLNYLLRCVPPDAVRNLARQFDTHVLDTFIEKLELGVQLNQDGNEQMVSQIRLPVRDGGFGMVSAEGHMDASYIGSLAATVQHHTSLGEFVSYGGRSDGGREGAGSLLPTSSSLYLHVQSSLNAIMNQMGSPQTFGLLLPPTPHEFFHSFNRQYYTAYRLQSRIVHSIMTTTQRSFHSSIQTTSLGRARSAAITAPNANTWITTIACENTSIIPSNHYRISARFQLGLPPADVMSSNCHSCRQRGNPGAQLVERDPWHHLNCMQGHGGREITIRHNAIKEAIARYARLAGAVVIVEPAGLFVDSNQRPDLQVILNHVMYLVDVTVVNPEAPTHVNHSGTPLGVAREAEKAKVRKYREAVMCGDKEGKRPSYKFVPFVVETHGGLGDEARKFLSALSVFAKENTFAISHYELMRGLRHSIAAALQRGNALIMLAGYANSERALRQ